MKKYYENYKVLITVTTLFGVYMPAIEKIFGDKWRVKSLKLMFILPFVSLVIFFGEYVKYAFYDEGKLNSKVYGVFFLVFSFNSLYVFLNFNLKIREFEGIFELWDSLFQEDLFPEDKEELQNKNRKFTIKWLLAFGGPSYVSAVIYFAASYFNPAKELPHPSGIPFRHASPDFEQVVTLEVLAAPAGFALLIIFDSMTMAILSQEEAQFTYLKKSLCRIADIVRVTDTGEVYARNERGSYGYAFETVNALGSSRMEKAFEMAERQLRVWMNHHREILRFHNEVQRIYAASFSIKYLIFILIICFCSFLGVTGLLDVKDIIMTIIFLFNLYATFYLTTRYADLTAETAWYLFGDAFSKAWYLYPKKMRTAFLIIIMRCRRRVNYKILGVFPLNSKTFLKILTTSYSFFTFLLQVNNSKQ